jgi:cyclohexyl-isocyanide hydratase
LLTGRRATSHWVTREALADFGAIPVNERVVKDGNILTGAGVSSGLDFALALVEMLRGKAYAQGLMLQAEYHPEPPFPGGTMASTPADVGQMMDDMFKPVAAQFKAMAKA